MRPVVRRLKTSDTRDGVRSRATPGRTAPRVPLPRASREVVLAPLAKPPRARRQEAGGPPREPRRPPRSARRALETRKARRARPARFAHRKGHATRPSVSPAKGAVAAGRAGLRPRHEFRPPSPRGARAWSGSRSRHGARRSATTSDSTGADGMRSTIAPSSSNAIRPPDARPTRRPARIGHSSLPRTGPRQRASSLPGLRRAEAMGVGAKTPRALRPSIRRRTLTGRGPRSVGGSTIGRRTSPRPCATSAGLFTRGNRAPSMRRSRRGDDALPRHPGVGGEGLGRIRVILAHFLGASALRITPSRVANLSSLIVSSMTEACCGPIPRHACMFQPRRKDRPGAGNTAFASAKPRHLARVFADGPTPAHAITLCCRRTAIVTIRENPQDGGCRNPGSALWSCRVPLFVAFLRRGARKQT